MRIRVSDLRKMVQKSLVTESGTLVKRGQRLYLMDDNGTTTYHGHVADFPQYASMEDGPVSEIGVTIDDRNADYRSTPVGTPRRKGIFQDY